jgi:hypothetical protein
MNAADSPFVGTWTYRSFHNEAEPTDGDTEKVAALLFGEAQMTIAEAPADALLGRLEFDGGGLELRGARSYGAPFTIRFQGVGSGAAEGWIYDYVAYLVPRWPHGVEQRPALVGSVIRTVPHDGASAGYVASFIAVKRGD